MKNLIERFAYLHVWRVRLKYQYGENIGYWEIYIMHIYRDKLPKMKNLPISLFFKFVGY